MPIIFSDALIPRIIIKYGTKIYLHVASLVYALNAMHSQANRYSLGIGSTKNDILVL